MTTLSPVEQKFIVHWGEMGTRWGVNRTVAQIHALLYLSPEPLHAEQIVNLLSVARSNVSNSLRELEDWGLVRATHVLGDRREHYDATKDVWEMMRIIIDQRKRREIDPAITALKSCAAELETGTNGSAYSREKVCDLLGLLETMTQVYDDLRKLPPGAFKHAFKARGKIKRALASF